jgi:hypothetical protein
VRPPCDLVLIVPLPQTEEAVHALRSCVDHLCAELLPSLLQAQAAWQDEQASGSVPRGGTCVFCFFTLGGDTGCVEFCCIFFLFFLGA